MSTTDEETKAPGTTQGIAAVVLAYFVPGLGHFCIGEKARGALFMITIHALFALGLLLAGIRAVGPQEQPIWSVTQYLAGWPTLMTQPMSKRAEQNYDSYFPAPQRTTRTKYDEEYSAFFPGHDRAQDVSLGAAQPPKDETPAQAAARVKAAKEANERRATFYKKFVSEHGELTYSPKIMDVGAVYCGIAGMLNLLVMFDVVLRVTGNLRHPPPTPPSPPGPPGPLAQPTGQAPAAVGKNENETKADGAA